jgi:hypothetical protein
MRCARAIPDVADEGFVRRGELRSLLGTRLTPGLQANARPRLENCNPAPSNFYLRSKSERGLPSSTWRSNSKRGLLSSRFVHHPAWLFPAKHFRRERDASEKHQSQRGYVADVRGPRVASPNPFQ